MIISSVFISSSESRYAEKAIMFVTAELNYLLDHMIDAFTGMNKELEKKDTEFSELYKKNHDTGY